MMNIKHNSCCDLVEQKVHFWFTCTGELVIESELLSKLYDYFEPTSVKSRVVMSESEVETLRNYLAQGQDMIKYKLYGFSGAMYVVPLDKYEHIDDIAESYFTDYCVGLLTSHELDSFVEECIIDNGGKCFDIWCDDYYVIMNKE